MSVCVCVCARDYSTWSGASLGTSFLFTMSPGESNTGSQTPASVFDCWTISVPIPFKLRKKILFRFTFSCVRVLLACMYMNRVYVRCLWGSEKDAKVPGTKPGPLHEVRNYWTISPAFTFLFWNRVSLNCLDCPQPCGSPASDSQVIGITGACSHTWHVYLNDFPSFANNYTEWGDVFKASRS